jgi:hypothetical protein
MRSPVSVLAHLSAAILIMATIPAGCAPVGEEELCVSRSPVLEGDGAFYELIDLLNLKVWGTPDFTPQEYAAFAPPFLWQKNDPRTMMGDHTGEFLRSPGCAEPGQYTYLWAFDKEFLNVVRLISMGQPADGEGLIQRTELEKYHLLTYSAGSTVHILENPTGERFIGVSRSADRSSDTFTLPDGWALTSHVLSAELEVNLSGIVSVLRTDNEDSFQGPLPGGISF